MRARLLFLAVLALGSGASALIGQTVTLSGSFSGSTFDPGWTVGGTGYAPVLTASAGGGNIDTAGNGWLRLTSAAGNQATYAYNANAFVSKDATIAAAFSYVSYGGTGADGITFFLADASKPFAVGAYGGSLGYAQKTAAGGATDIAGMNGGYIGLGIDEFGNYANNSEGRIGGFDTNPATATPDAVSVRGPGQGLTGYNYLGGTGIQPTSLDTPGSATRPTATTFQIIITATNQLTVYMDRGATGTFTTLYNIDLSGYSRPDSLIMGFTGSTGGSTNIHEVKTVALASVVADIWTNAAGDSNWGTNNSWYGDPSGQVPANFADVLLDNRYVSTAQTINVGTNRTVRSLQIDAPFAYTLNNGSLTFDSGGILGPSGIFVSKTNGSATQTINSPITLNNGIQIQNNSAGALVLGGTIDTNGKTIDLNGTGTTGATGVISGTGAIRQTGTGTTTFSGANTYTGATTISGGTLNANNATALGTSAVTLAGGTLGSTNASTIGNTVSLTGSAGLSGVTTGGALTQTGGSYTLNMAGATQSGAVNLSNDTTARTLTVQVNSGTSTISGIIANGGGSTGGNLTKTGVGTLTLSGANTYNGTTTISAGTVKLGASNVLADTSAMNIAGGTLDLSGNSDKVGNLTFSNGASLDFGSATTSNSFVFANLTPAPTGVLTVNNYVGPDSSNFAGAGDFLGSTTALSGALVNQIYFSGYGTGSLQNSSLTDAGNGLGNAYRIAPQVINWNGYTWVSNADQQWGTNANWNGTVAPPNLANPTDVFVNFGTGTQATVNSNTSSTINALRFSSAAIGYTISGTSTLTFQNGTSLAFVQQQSANNQTLSPASIVIKNNMVFDITGAGDLTVGAPITDGAASLSLTKTGSGGKLILTQANTYDGGTSIQSGVVQAQNTGALGTGSVTVSDGAALNLAGGISPTNTVTVGGSGVGGNGAIRNVSGTNTLSGTITQTADTRVQSDAGTLTVSGTIAGTDKNLTVGGAGNTTVSGTITTGAGTVTKDGAGTLTYSGAAANTYTGDTTVNAGTLALSKTANINSVVGNLIVNAGTVSQTTSGQIAANKAVTLNGGTYALSDGTAGSINQTIQTLNTASGSTVNLGTADILTVSGTGISTVSGLITGTGGLVTSGTGTVFLGGANTYSGGTTIGSIVTAANSTSLGSGTSTVSSGGNLQLQGGVNLANAFTLSGPGTNANDGAIENFSGNNTLSGVLTLAAATRIQSSDGTLTLANTVNTAGQTLTLGGLSDTTVTGVITGTGGVTKDGSGTLTYNGTAANTYTGTTTVNAGTLALSQTANVTAIAGNLAVSGGTVNQTTSGQLASTSGITLTGGTYNLEGTGSVTQSVQTVTTSSGSIVNLGTSDTLTINGSSTSSVAGVISGAGNLTQAGSGTITLSGANTYTGTTTISAGTVQLGASNRLADTSSLNLAGGALNLAGYSEKVGDLNFTSGGSLDFGSTAGNNSFVFSTVNAAATGVLTVNNYVGPTVTSATDSAFATAGDFLGATTSLTTDQVGQIYFSGYGVGSFQNTTLRDAGNSLGNAYRIAPTVDAFGYVWIGSNSSQPAWNRTQNWSGTNIPTNTANPTNVFVSFGTGSTSAVNFDASATINALRFTGSTGYTISGANTLTFDNRANSAVSYVQQQSAQNQTLAPSSIVLQSNLVVDTTGAGSLTINSAISGTASLTKTGNGGALTLGGTTANTYTGDTTVNAGTLNLSKTANVTAVAGNLVVNGGTVNQTTSGQIASAKTITVNSGTYNLEGTGSVTQTVQALNTSSGSTVNLGASDTLTLSGSAASTVSGVITGTGNLTKNSTGTLTLNSANTYTGATTLSGTGTTSLGVANAFSSSSSITVSTGAILDLNGYAQSISNLQSGGTGNSGGTIVFDGSTLTLTGGASSFGGDFSGSGTIVINAGQSLTLTDSFNAANINIVLNGGSLFLGNGLTQTFGSLTVNGATGSVIDFGTSGSTVAQFSSVNVTGAGTLAVNNWTDMVDYFLSSTTTGAQGTTPNTQIVFAGYSGGNTKWIPLTGGTNGQLTPVPEPSTYGALMLGSATAFMFMRRRRKN
jgi:fibronectin-binding autotransporter adhesin